MRLVLFCFVLLFFGVLSCTKEKSFEVAAPARGSLQSSATNECLPKIMAGSFIAGNALTDSNYLEVDVDVASAGSYTIKTDTLNGYSFSGSGNFTKTGINRVRLTGSGTPVAEGQDPFAVLFDTTLCIIPVTVLPAGSNSGPAVFTLQKGPGDSCMAATVSGSYAKGTALNSTSTAAIKVAVTTPGTYTVTTNTVNGFFFSGSNTIAATGEQTITLVASGTPAAEGIWGFTVTAGGSTCAFPVTVTAEATPPPVGTGDLFPLTPNSWWSYTDDLTNVEDSTLVTNTRNSVISGKTYSVLEYSNGAGEPALDSIHYRKSGDEYYAYLPVDTYTNILFDPEVKGEILFLKENLKINDSWNSAEFPGTASNISVKLRYVFTCTAANTTESRGGKTYPNVYFITAKPQLSNGGPYVATGEEIEWHFAKGIGLIYEKGSVGGMTDYESFLLNSKIF